MAVMAAEESAGGSFRLIVGLGNPGRRYEKTRHNIGFLLVDRLAAGDAAGWALERKWEAEVARGASGIFYLKPQTFMNLSGGAVAAVAQYVRILPEQILVVCDDADLPLETLRFRASGSAGGHNGLKSIIASLGTEAFARLKIGIEPGGGRGQVDLADHVLSKFSVDEETIVEKTLDRAVEAVQTALSQGLEAAMTRFNRRPGLPREDEPPPVEKGKANQERENKED